MDNKPDVFTINLAWAGEPSSFEILKLLVSIPSSFDLKSLFKAEGSAQARYVFKGMICYQAAHYLSFFRRMVVRPEYFKDNDANSTD
jgi:hypothetical protein